ncbi:lipoprotein N-acyltransferase Lnb domain-containing protein [Marinirhabdus gelatinilytica]|uniref:Uncharacterized protein DUF4105 n=1 Tax=Marinirhabdus gelatinilytica TaxID=1703343 RepID=A0A370Q8Y6_9FLAO|nr:DUF4105 domain-containing protein [Marinirhabdus gelatinilytica]RDK84832.1 uncharacterized protein DUF4105 [Marinirhabdus gelatinilytica]
MFQKFAFAVLIFLLNISASAQYTPLSPSAEVSILTMGPGDNLYDKFGHSAFYIQDPERGIDAVYNYGVYDFDTPNFYTKFAQGKLLYKLEGVKAQPFIAHYKAQDRWIKQQVLNLSYSEKQALFNFLNNNLKPENKYYKYDFFYDNCATKIRDVLVSVLGNDLEYVEDFSTEQKTFRELIQQNVHWNSWGSLGMDVAIGAVTDIKANSWQYQFLPDYVYKAAATAQVGDGEKTPLVKETYTLYESSREKETPNFFTSPLLIFLVIGLVIIGITVKDIKNKERTRALDATILGVTGVVGILLSLLWFATDHSATANNYNLLWAFPFSIFIVVVIAKKQPKVWVRRYVLFLLLLLSLLALHWFTGVQEFAYGFIPLFIALTIRYVYLLKALK